jgi:P4 family phage/plasmid primase-like protien
VAATAHGLPPPAKERIAALTFAVSMFRTLSDTAPSATEWSWHQMVEKLTTFAVLENKTCATLWSPARFREGGFRCAADVMSISTMVFDLDHVESLSLLVHQLEEELPFAAILYTTFRNTAGANRCRIALPLLRPVAASEWSFFHETALKWFAEKFRTPLDPCKDPPRFYFLPSHPLGGDHVAHVFHEWDECYLNPQPMIDAGRDAAQRLEAERKARRDATDAVTTRTGRASALRHYVDTAIDDQLADLAGVQPGGQNDGLNTAAFSLTSLLAGADLLDEWPDIEGRMVHIAVNVWTFTREPWTEAVALRTIRSGYNAGVKHPRPLSHVGAWQAEDTSGGWAPPQAAPEPDQPHGAEPDPGQEPDAAEADDQDAKPEAGPQPVARRALTDTGNAVLFASMFHDVFRHVPELGHPIIWDGRRWAIDKAGRALEMTKQVTERIRADATEPNELVPSERAVKAAVEWAKTSESKGKREAMLRLASVESSVVANFDTLDRDPFLLTVNNGTFNLRSRVLRPHAPDDLITKLAPVTYRLGAQCPRWLAFLDRIFEGNQDLIAYVQRWFGYALTGDVREQAFAVLYGTGANGKTVFIETLAALAGDYAMHINLESLTTNRQSSSVSNDLARLRGARTVFGTELNAGARLAEATIKELTGNDTITARFLFQEYFEFKPCLKLFMALNHRPRVSIDPAIFRRIKLIPFAVTIPQEERDPNLKALLLEELDGIFNWALDGVSEWLRHGLGECEAVTAGTSQYQADMDPLGDFLAQCARLRPDARVNVGAFYRAYCSFIEREYGKHIKVMTPNAFSRLLKSRAIVSKGGTARTYVGAELTEEGAE